ncbi:beta-ketoacyl synthase chain length factor [Vibrio sinaloensis]|uniref:beta-ketoacyl synthase chain length factor n=1 Tax=Photobacterium sp. (strain ATCC 43367) TaxID=379097 RepID=UPI00206BF1E3|nr:beta-ketoacyl synthase chain length factor [Vibrio sinaloensis]UPQ89357.1 beta-ketoacyl synthase chain length factor [Vibrio sinaloensis]
MPKSDLFLSFNIDTWCAHSSGLSQSQEWEKWASHLCWPENGQLECGAIPAMMRRRMSSLSKVAVQTAIELLNQHQVDYLVFASRHGELQRSIALVRDILSGEPASPMAFSQSVHNTAAGLATIATKQAIPLTSVAASENTFHSALIEAWLYLEANPSSKVLLVDFDEPLPQDYLQFEQQSYQGYALGLVLSKGDTMQLSRQAAGQFDPSALPAGLRFLQHYLLKHQQWQIETPMQTWSWYRKQ